MKIQSAGLVIIRSEEILLVRQRKSFSKRNLSIPKGQIEGMESLLEAAVRETYEETGLQIKVEEHKFAGPFLLCYTNSKNIYKEVYYYVVRVEKDLSLDVKDSKEIQSARFYCYESAEKELFFQQLSVLNHLDMGRFSSSDIQWLLRYEYVYREKHPIYDIYVYNYSDKCKKEGYWNETTLWCRGLILNAENIVIARPLKKFFEYYQLYEIFRNNLINNSFKVYEKLDGSLGIIYWIDGLPFFATRGSFVSEQAYHATNLLYSKYYEILRLMNPNYSYFFEIIYPGDRHLVDYNKIDDVFLLGAYDNLNHREVFLDELFDLPYSKAPMIQLNKDLFSLMKEDESNKEGFVIQFLNGERLKIKFQSYKAKFINNLLK